MSPKRILFDTVVIRVTTQMNNFVSFGILGKMNGCRDKGITEKLGLIKNR